MKLLFHPHIEIGEGRTGYLRRLADANRVSLNDLEKLGVRFDLNALRNLKCLPPANQNAELDHYAALLAQGFSDPKVAWVDRVGRYCPVCLTESPRWRVGWELQFCDACPDHNVWLIDTCACGRFVDWGRRDFGKCDCGRSLANERPSECPKVVGQLSSLLNTKLLDQDSSCEFEVSKSLTLPQLQRLIRFIGTYGDPQPGPKPQKLAFQDRLSVSWPITSLAGEILGNWPNSLYQVLDRLQRERADEGGGRLTGRFGYLYTALYKAFPEDEFSQLRDAFENYVADHWRGALGARNRRLPPGILQRAAWIPSNHACECLGISASRLVSLVAENKIAGETRFGPSGREFMVVRRIDVDAQMEILGQEIDLISAARLLGITKRRLSALRPSLFPDAYKTTNEASTWAIPRAQIDRLIEITEATEATTDVPADFISLGHVLKFWSLSDCVLAEAIKAVIAKELAPRFFLKGAKPIPGLVFNEQGLRDWLSGQRSSTETLMTIPELALRMQVKQEVAYALVRLGLIETTLGGATNRRNNLRVSPEALEQFGKRYVFARDLAANIGRSPRALVEKLTLLGVQPICGPAVGCRQVIYESGTMLKNAMSTLSAAT